MRVGTLHVRLLGGLALRVGDSPVPALGSARAESLLAFLLLHRDHPQPRQHLAFLLWPDSTEPQARTNLRHVLHNLRRSVPDVDRFIEVRPRTLQWRTQAPLWLDVAVFEQAVADGRLQDAVEAYTGELLEGIYDDWVLEERERLAQLHIAALERLTRELEAQQRWPLAIRYAERLVRQDPLREEAYRLLMRLYDASGDRARAVRVFHVCAATLQRELGVEPAAATRAAYESLLPAVPETQAARGTASPAGPALVGRSAERAQLSAAWRVAGRGSAQLVLVTGEPGVGKSRLVEELRLWCGHGGAVTAEARAYAAEGAMAYGLVATWLRSEAIAARLARLDRVDLSELARLLPELLAEMPDLAGPEPLPESEQRQRLFRAIAKGILAAGTPLLLVADDLQWCDTESLQFVHYLLRAEPEQRLLIAATARREEMSARHPANELLTALEARGDLTEIGLDRLSREETGVLAERITSKPLAEADADRLYQESEGNPLFVVEALRAQPAAGASPGTGSSKVQAVIAARLAQLSESAAKLVGVAATIGREFTTQVLADASEASDQALVRGLDELWRRGILRAHGPNAYDFSHGKIREAAYRALSPAQARLHHLRAARALQGGGGAPRRRAGDRDAASGQIAAHYEAAGAAPEAVEWYITAAEAAQRLHASADAVRFLERALRLAPGLPAGADRAALELRLLSALPAPLVTVEGYLSERVAEVHGRALALATQLGVEPAAPLIRSLALATLTRGDFEAARPLGEQLRARAVRDGDDVLWVESAYILGVAAFWQGQLETARRQFEAAVERFRPEHRTEHLLRYGQDPAVFCLLRLAYTRWLLGRVHEAGRARDEALALAERSGHPYTQITTTAWAALLSLDQRDEERLRRYVRSLASGDGTRPAKQVRTLAEALAGFVEVLDGRGREGIDRVRRALDDARAGQPAAPGQLAMHMRILLEAYAKAGDATAGLAVADEALEMGGGAQLWEPEIRRLRGGFLAALGAAPEVVEAELMRAVEAAERHGSRSLELRVRESIDHLAGGTP